MNLLRLSRCFWVGLAVCSSLARAVESASVNAPVRQEQSFSQEEPPELTIQLNTEPEQGTSCVSEAPIEDSSPVMVCSVSHAGPVVAGGEPLGPLREINEPK